MRRSTRPPAPRLVELSVAAATTSSVKKDRAKSRPKPKEKGTHTTKLNEQDGGDEVQPVQPFQQAVLQTFTTNVNIPEGLCVVRSLGNGLFEVLNLSQTSIHKLTSFDSMELLIDDQNRVETLNEVKRDWAGLQFKVEQTVKSVNKDIFRFEKLPFELRLKVYDFAIISRKRVKHYENNVVDANKRLGFPLMETCRWIYNECQPIFYKENTFLMSDPLKTMPWMLTNLREKLRYVAFSWWAFARKDPMTFEYFNTCPNLQTFNLIVTRFACNVHGTYHQVQKRFPNEPSIEPFGRANGFDQLVSMRGLKKITVTREQGEYAAPIATFPDSKLQALEDFLTQWVTQPKVIPRGPKTKTPEQLEAEERRLREREEEAKFHRDDGSFRKPARLAKQPPTSTSSRPWRRAAAATATANNKRILDSATLSFGEDGEQI